MKNLPRIPDAIVSAEDKHKIQVLILGQDNVIEAALDRLAGAYMDLQADYDHLNGVMEDIQRHLRKKEANE